MFRVVCSDHLEVQTLHIGEWGVVCIGDRTIKYVWFFFAVSHTKLSEASLIILLDRRALGLYVENR